MRKSAAGALAGKAPASGCDSNQCSIESIGFNGRYGPQPVNVWPALGRPGVSGWGDCQRKSPLADPLPLSWSEYPRGVPPPSL
ncbi:MAG: hypothetical protein D6744_12915, partial [Planctomycetota bacterium]